MLIYYRLSGLIADVALVLNLVILLACMAAFGATLTLPGIAGIALTIGMAVDTNVLIFERIREERRLARPCARPSRRVRAGVLRTIIDTHLTVMVTAGILYNFGTGPVKGFAVSLFVGLAGQPLHRLLLHPAALRPGLPGPAEGRGDLHMIEIFRSPNYNFIGQRRWAYLFSLVTLIIGLVSLGVYGLKYDIDFTGGSIVQVPVRSDAVHRRGAPGAEQDRAGRAPSSRSSGPRVSTSFACRWA